MLQIGQELWYVPQDRRDYNRARSVKVEKIGRRWATLDNGERIDMETMRAAEQRIRALNDELADACSALKTAKSELNKAMRAKH